MLDPWDEKLKQAEEYLNWASINAGAITILKAKHRVKSLKKAIVLRRKIWDELAKASKSPKKLKKVQKDLLNQLTKLAIKYNKKANKVGTVPTHPSVPKGTMIDYEPSKLQGNAPPELSDYDVDLEED